MMLFLHTMVAAALILILPGLPPEPALCGEPDAIVLRTAVKPEGEIWVGQRVDLQVDVLARDGWAQIKRIRDFEVPGAYVVRLETQGTRLSETVAGTEYGGQRYEMSLFPQQGGRISVPPIPVEVDVRRWGAQAEADARQMKTPAAAFDVKVPPGAENLKMLISTTDLEARQQWTPAAAEFKVGEAVKRTIALRAADVAGMTFAPLGFPPMEGLGVYPGEPVVDDRYSRGALAGRRTESVTYVFEKKGAFQLPAIEIPWWDVDRRQLKTAVLPALKVRISAVTGAAAGTPAADGSRGRTIRLTVSFLLLLVLSGIAWRFRFALGRGWQRWRQARGRTEKAFFGSLRAACRQNDAKAAYQRLAAWLNQAASGNGAATLKDLLDRAGSVQLATEVSELERRLFKKSGESDAPPPWNGNALYRELAQLRNRGMKKKEAPPAGGSTLAPLNPR